LKEECWFEESLSCEGVEEEEGSLEERGREEVERSFEVGECSLGDGEWLKEEGSKKSSLEEEGSK
jgi:hypothetical protein